MALQSSGQISLADVAGEFGGSTPHSLSEYYGVAAGVPSSGVISLSHFYGKSNVVVATISGIAYSTNLIDLFGGVGNVPVGNYQLDITNGQIRENNGGWALLIQSFPAGCNITINVLDGYILGSGGAANGGAGGHAVWYQNPNVNVTINIPYTGGYGIYAGGGGGGRGGNGGTGGGGFYTASTGYGAYEPYSNGAFYYNSQTHFWQDGSDDNKLEWNNTVIYNSGSDASSPYNYGGYEYTTDFVTRASFDNDYVDWEKYGIRRRRLPTSYNVNTNGGAGGAGGNGGTGQGWGTAVSAGSTGAAGAFGGTNAGRGGTGGTGGGGGSWGNSGGTGATGATGAGGNRTGGFGGSAGSAGGLAGFSVYRVGSNPITLNASGTIVGRYNGS